MNIFKQLVTSIYSPKDIAKFRFQGIGKTILFVFFLTLISIIPTAYYFSSAISNGIEATKISIEDEIPEFEVKDGELFSDQNTPITIKKDGFTILFDSTGTVEKTDLENTDNAIALLKNHFLLIAAGDIQEFPYTMFANMTISKADLESFVDTVDSLVFIIISIFSLVTYIFTSGIKFIEVSVLAALGLLVKNMVGRNLAYRQLWRMAAYSVTLPTLFFTIMGLLKTNVPSGFLLNWFVGLTILYLAVKEVPAPKKKD
jgi:putative sterol carrier protein